MLDQSILRGLLNQRPTLNTKYWMNFMALVETKSFIFYKYLAIRKRLKVHEIFHCIFVDNIPSDLGAWSVEYHLQDCKQNELVYLSKLLSIVSWMVYNV